MNRIRLWVHGTVTMPVKWHWRCHLVVRWETIVNQGSNYGCSRHDTEPALGVHNFCYEASIHNPFEEVELHKLGNGSGGKAFGFPDGGVSPFIRTTSINLV